MLGKSRTYNINNGRGRRLWCNKRQKLLICSWRHSTVFIPDHVSVNPLPKEETLPSADVLNKFFEPSTPFFAFLLAFFNNNNLRTDAIFSCIIRGEFAKEILPMEIKLRIRSEFAGETFVVKNSLQFEKFISCKSGFRVNFPKNVAFYCKKYTVPDA